MFNGKGKFFSLSQECPQIDQEGPLKVERQMGDMTDQFRLGRGPMKEEQMGGASRSRIPYILCGEWGNKGQTPPGDGPGKSKGLQARLLESDTSTGQVVWGRYRTHEPFGSGTKINK